MLNSMIQILDKWTSFITESKEVKNRRKYILDALDIFNRNLNALSDDKQNGYTQLNPGIYEKELFLNESLSNTDGSLNRVQRLISEGDRILTMLFDLNGVFTRHRHDRTEVIYCLEGAFEDRVSGMKCSKGEKMVIPPNTSHTFHAVKPGMAIIVIGQILNTDALKVVSY